VQIVKNIPHGMPPFSANQWAPITNIDKLLPLAFIVMAVDMLESTSIARALARKNSYGKWLLGKACRGCRGWDFLFACMGTRERGRVV
jgi:MFS superfamily sulfate permease-like transporter